MDKTFKLTNMTVTYHGMGQYTLTPAEGYRLKNRKTGELLDGVQTKDYTQWKPVQSETPAASSAGARKPRKTTKKA